MDTRGMLWIYHGKNRRETVLHGADALHVSHACHWVGMNYSFFLFFSWEKHWSWNQGSPVWQSACVTAPCQSPTHLFQRQPCLVCFPSVPYSTHPLLSFKEFSLYPPSASCFCLLLKRLIRTSFDGSLDCLSVEKEEWCLKRLYVRVNSFKRACE